MHGVGIVATHGCSSAFSSLMSHIDPLFHPHPWTIAVPVLTDFLFLVDKRNPLLLACKAPAQWHSLSSCVSCGATYSFPNSLLYLPKPPFPLSLPGGPSPSPRPHSVFMVQPGCLSVLVGSLILPTHLPSLVQCLPHVPVLLCFSAIAFISPFGKYVQLPGQSGL